MAQSRASRTRISAIAAAVALLCAALAGCSSDDDDDGANLLAQQLVDALAAPPGDVALLARVPLTPETATQDAAAQTAEVLDPLLTASGLPAPPVVLGELELPEVSDDAPPTARATLRWQWPIGAGDGWEYETSADLRLVEGAGDADPFWAVAWHPDILVPELQPGERLDVARIPAERATILDGSGSALVVPRPVWRIGIDKTFTDAYSWESGARALVDLIAQAGYVYDADSYVNRVLGAGDRAFVELITLRQENSPVSRSEVEQVRGGRALDEVRELAPTAAFARALLGATGEATAEIIEASEGRIVAGDTTGLSGLQQYYDTQLAGVPGVAVFAYGGDARRELFRLDPVDGVPLATTLNQQFQLAAEQVLADVTPGAAIVAIQPSTGQVVVAANGPGSAGANLALLGQYPPGSTFKIVDALAFHRAGLAADTLVPCTESIEVDGRVFRNVPGYPAGALGEVPFRIAFANSCNTAFISQAGIVPQSALATAGADLGLGVTSSLGVGAYFGSVPETATGTEHAGNLLGQGTIAASPFAMARVAASVAAGHRVDPVLVYRPEPRADDDAAAALPDPNTMTAAEAEFLQGLMAAVVAEGSGEILADIPGIQGAKTGTAQFGDGSQSHTWMAATIDTRVRDDAGQAYSGIDLAVAVFVAEGEFGATTSGPLMRQFLLAVTGG